MPEMQFSQIEQDGMIFNGRFTHPDFAGARIMFRVKLYPVCEDGFWFWSDCSVEKVREAKRVKGYRDESQTPDDYFRFKISRTNTEEEGNCMILTYKWRMWAGIIPVVDGEVELKGLGIKAKGSGGLVPDKSGEFLIKVCCDDDCNPTANFLGEPDLEEELG